MAARGYLRPTDEQCMSLTDEQCRLIQDLQDPQGLRAHKNWELAFQPELIRLYMTHMSYAQIEAKMKTTLKWTSRTYSSRFKHWGFPSGPKERQAVIIDLYWKVANANIVIAAEGPFSAHTRNSFPMEPSHPSQSSQSSQLDATEWIPATTISPATPRGQEYEPYIPFESFTSASSIRRTLRSSEKQPMHVEYAWPSLQPAVLTSESDHSFNSHYHDSLLPQSGAQSHESSKPVHDAETGLWNGSLRVVNCGTDHSELMWFTEFERCLVCGFSQWHSLMIHARSLNVAELVVAMRDMTNPIKFDFAGNSPMHFLMSSSAGLESVNYLCHHGPLYDGIGRDFFAQNVFGQNPLHVLNLQNLDDLQLIDLLKHFAKHGDPHGVLLSQRDIRCHTPMQTILQHPLDSSMYQRVINIFPCAPLAIRSFDTSGQTVVDLMNDAIEEQTSLTDRNRIHQGIDEFMIYRSEVQITTRRYEQYNFHAIARGARPIHVPGHPFSCHICNNFGTHSSSTLHRMICARDNHGDCNAPDETGSTPAHLLITQSRLNEHKQPETQDETLELFQALLPRHNHNFREALHALDPEGNSLIFNIATHGFSDILIYALSLEDPSRHSSMVNTSSERADHLNLGLDDQEWSILEAVEHKIDQLHIQTTAAAVNADAHLVRRLCGQSSQLAMCRLTLLAAGAEKSPSVTTRWKICD